MFTYYRRAPSGLWHILHAEDAATVRDPVALCGEALWHMVEGYAPAGGRRVHDPTPTCERCKLLADGARQLALLGV